MQPILSEILEWMKASLHFTRVALDWVQCSGCNRAHIFSKTTCNRKELTPTGLTNGEKNDQMAKTYTHSLRFLKPPLFHSAKLANSRRNETQFQG